MMTKAEKQRLEELLAEDEQDGTQLMEIKARTKLSNATFQLLSFCLSLICLFVCVGRGG